MTILGWVSLFLWYPISMPRFRFFVLPIPWHLWLSLVTASSQGAWFLTNFTKGRGKEDSSEVECTYCGVWFQSNSSWSWLWITCCLLTLRVLANLLELVLLSVDGEKFSLHNVKSTCEKTSSPWFTLHVFLWNLLFRKETFWFVPAKDCLLPLDAPNSVIRSLPCPPYWEEGGWCCFYIPRFLDLYLCLWLHPFWVYICAQ